MYTDCRRRSDILHHILNKASCLLLQVRVGQDVAIGPPLPKQCGHRLPPSRRRIGPFRSVATPRWGPDAEDGER